MVGYGATYYSYLYAKCMAASSWQQHMAADPFSREAGASLQWLLSCCCVHQRTAGIGQADCLLLSALSKATCMEVHGCLGVAAAHGGRPLQQRSWRGFADFAEPVLNSSIGTRLILCCLQARRYGRTCCKWGRRGQATSTPGSCWARTRCCLRTAGGCHAVMRCWTASADCRSAHLPLGGMLAQNHCKKQHCDAD